MTATSASPLAPVGFWDGTSLVFSREAREFFANRAFLMQNAVLGAVAPVLIGFFQLPRLLEGGSNGLVLAVMMQAALFPFISGLQATVAAFAGERERRTLAPLLATDLPNVAIFLGKTLAVYLSSMLTSIISIVALLVSASLATSASVASFSEVARVVLLAAIFGFVLVALGIVVSTKIGALKSAQSISGLVMLPVVGGGMYLAFKSAQSPDRVISGAVLGLLAILVVVFVTARQWRREEALLMGAG